MNPRLILPKPVNDFMDQFSKKGFEIYLVGGAIRHLVLGQTTDNWDFTTNATPEKIQSLFPNSFIHNDFGTVSIPIAVKNQTLLFEVTPFRRESGYSDKRHPDRVAWAKTIEEDLARRDFTINTLAYDGKNLVDLFNGLADIKNKLIRAVGDPNKRFAEDALRLLRAIRFAAQLGFLIEEKTRTSIEKNAPLIKHISAERIRDELLKIVISDNPAEGVLFLRNTSLLKQILPELDTCFDIPQKSPLRHHIYDVGTHSVQALRLCPSTDPITRLATLLHDIGKAPTFKKDEATGLITFYDHEIVGARQAAEIADRLRLSREQKKKLVTLVRFHMFTVSENQTDKAIRRFIRNVGKEYLQDALDLRVADRLGSGARLTSWRTELFKKRLEEVQKETFEIKDLEIDGNDVMKALGIKPGPKVGEVLQQIFDEVEKGKLKNNRDDLLGRLKKIK